MWDAPRYCDSINRKGRPNSGTEDTLLLCYPPLNPVAEVVSPSQGNLPVIREPVAITDRHGHLLVVSLPQVLTPERQVSVDLLGLAIPGSIDLTGCRAPFSLLHDMWRGI